ncbi:hypothetical protein ANN_08081 [Periplaneta americana]|uniref:Uncharacterized protein n=1 Tax=Periplaneta americana TaxID=6978 RepID=A0ABQ8T2N4_PERAM|nr:hypothetical protein ANN_08081 [Periplaneta americana]
MAGLCGGGRPEEDEDRDDRSLGFRKILLPSANWGEFTRASLVQCKGANPFSCEVCGVPLNVQAFDIFGDPDLLLFCHARTPLR